MKTKRTTKTSKKCEDALLRGIEQLAKKVVELEEENNRLKKKLNKLLKEETT